MAIALGLGAVHMSDAAAGAPHDDEVLAAEAESDGSGVTPDAHHGGTGESDVEVELEYPLGADDGSSVLTSHRVAGRRGR